MRFLTKPRCFMEITKSVLESKSVNLLEEAAASICKAMSKY